MLKVVKAMEAMYPRYAEVFTLAYPLDEDVIGLRDAKDTEETNTLAEGHLKSPKHRHW